MKCIRCQQNEATHMVYDSDKNVVALVCSPCAEEENTEYVVSRITVPCFSFPESWKVHILYPEKAYIRFNVIQGESTVGVFLDIKGSLVLSAPIWEILRFDGGVVRHLPYPETTAEEILNEIQNALDEDIHGAWTEEGVIDAIRSLQENGVESVKLQAAFGRIADIVLKDMNQ